MMQVTTEIAARNNAELCHAVLAAHAITATFVRDCWYSNTALPELYPNLVTLSPGFDPEGLSFLTIDRAWAVKDSFATLDLAPHGFTPIVEASWLCHPGSGIDARKGEVIWEQVQSPATFGVWAALWGRDNPGLTRSPMTLRLLAQPALRLLAGKHDGRIVAGCIVNASPDVVGLSNLFHAADAPADWLATCLAFVAREYPDLPIVDYETDDDAALLLTHGFQRLGPLRIWLRSA